MKDDLKNKQGNNIPNPDDFWPDAKELLDKHYAAKKRKILFWRWGSALVVILLIASGLFYNLSFSDKVSLNDDTKKRKAQYAKDISKSVMINKQKPVTRNSDLKTIGKENGKVKSIAKLNSSAINIPSKNDVVASNSKQNPLSKKLMKKKSKEKNIVNYDETAAITPSQFEKELVVENYLKTTQRQNVNSSEQTQILNKDDVGVKQIFEFVLLKTPDFYLDKMLVENDIKIQLIDNEKLKQKMDDYAQNKNNVKYSIAPYSGLQQVSKKLNSNAENAEYAMRRSNEELKTNTLYYGLKFTMQKNKLLFSSGLEYNTFSEKNKYNAVSKQWQVSDVSKWNTYTKQIVTVDTIYHFGIKQYVYNYKTVADSSLQTQYDSVLTKLSNKNILVANTKTKISYIEIPLLIGYAFGFNKLTISPIAGIATGFLVQKKGMYLNKTLTDIENISANKSIKNLMLNYCIQLQFAYSLTTKFSVFITPQYKANAISITQKSFGVNTFYRSYGCGFGLNYKL